MRVRANNPELDPVQVEQVLDRWRQPAREHTRRALPSPAVSSTTTPAPVRLRPPIVRRFIGRMRVLAHGSTLLRGVMDCLALPRRQARLMEQVRQLERAGPPSRLDDLERRLEAVASQLSERRIQAPAAVPEGTIVEAGAYPAGVDDLFRGDEASVTRRLEPYLTDVLAARAGGADRPVLDVGAGRGEWLGLLAAHGLHTRGCDASAPEVERLQAQTMDVTCADGVAWLMGQSQAGAGAVTAYHVIEHLPAGQIPAFLDAALHALAPGGLLILETPNPENLEVATRLFWRDLTHRAPLPPELLEALVMRAGFVHTELRRLNPPPGEQALPAAGPAEHRLNQMLGAPQDYAVLARRPQEAAAW